jgi:GNAT superfamily N-acetyltransferase
LLIRRLGHDEIDTIWTIDRSEVIHRIYRLRQGELVSEPAYCDASGWPPGEIENVTPSLHACYRRGGGFYGIFEGGVLVGAAVIDGERIGPGRDWIALKFLYVSRSHRGKGVGSRLFEHAKAMARRRGARRLYISSTPTESTVNFYLRLGCEIAPEPDPELFALEPEDIHLICEL